VKYQFLSISLVSSPLPTCLKTNAGGSTFLDGAAEGPDPPDEDPLGDFPPPPPLDLFADVEVVQSEARPEDLPGTVR